MADYRKIVEHYEQCFEKHGDSHLGVDWPNLTDANRRYRIMLEVAPELRKSKDAEVSILDFGCGCAHLLEYLRANKFSRVKYRGLDVSEEFVRVSNEKFPEEDFICCDVLREPLAVDVDYVIMNGVFTEKLSLSFEEMFDYMRKVVIIAWGAARKGMAFNFMSKHVDWERDDLFHLSFDQLASFLSREISRNFVFRQDYGLYEYSVYVYREPVLL